MDMGSFMQQFVQQLINGISLGSIYALVALGYTMIYGIIKLINFAHGDIYMLGAYFGFIATTMFGFSFIPAILFSMACAALAGIIIERVAYRPMRNAPRIAILITAIGVSFFLEYSMILIATPQPRTFPAVFEATIYHFGPLVVNSQQIVILISALILMAVLTYIVQNTNRNSSLHLHHRESCGYCRPEPAHSPQTPFVLLHRGLQPLPCKCPRRHTLLLHHTLP